MNGRPRLSYQLPDFSEVGINNSIITGWVSPDFQPTYLPGLGSWINDEPGLAANQRLWESTRARNKLVYGAVAATTVYGVDLTANFYATPDHIGWFTRAPLPAPTGASCAQAQWSFLPCDTFAGDFLGPAAGLRDFLLQRRFSRDFIYGGSASYTIPTLDFPGADSTQRRHLPFLRRLHSAQVVLDRRTAIVNPAIKPTRIGEINMTLDGERYVRWSQRFPSMYLLGEWNYKSRSTVITDIYEPTLGHKGIHTVGYIADPVLPEQHLGCRLVALCDTNVGGNWFMQPSVTYKPTSNQEYNVFWNFTEGTVVKPGTGHTNPSAGTGSKLGSGSSCDAIYFRAVYKM